MGLEPTSPLSCAVLYPLSYLAVPGLLLKLGKSHTTNADVTNALSHWSGRVTLPPDTPVVHNATGERRWQTVTLKRR